MGAAYGGYFAAIGCFFPFIALYYRHLELSGAQLGVLLALAPLATAFLAPFWGLVADIYGAHRLVLCGALVLAALVSLALSQVTTFVPILGLVALLALVGAPSLALLDSFGVTISERTGIAYGRVRLWGSAGYIASSAFFGWLMGGEVSSRFLIGYALALVLTAAVVLRLPARLQHSATVRSWRGASALVRRPAIVVLLLTTYLVAISTSAMYNLMGIYMAELGGSTRLIGAANSISAISEVPVLLAGAALTARLGSRRMLIVACTVYTIRLLALSVVPGPAWVLPVQLLHGLSFGINLMASVTLVNQLAGRELAATAQGLLASAFAFGSITGSLVWGALLDRIEIMLIFRIAALAALAGLALFVLGSRAFRAPE
jgi:oligosaccharide:H+ symporter